jgi:arsenate reductase
MAEIKAYMYNKCGTCRKAKKWMDEQGVAYEEIPIVETPPSEGEIREIWKKSGVELKKMFNTSGQSYKELGLKDKLKTMSEDEMFKLLASDGKLLKRPLIVSDDRATVGFKEENMEQIWK